MEEKEACRPENLNQTGRVRTCYVNPDDPEDLEIEGSKSWGESNFGAILSWTTFTFCICCLCMFGHLLADR